MKKEAENPFKYGTVVAGEYFTDRTKEVIEIEHALMSPNHLVLISPRRFGKSSLVKKAVEQVERPALFVNMQQITGVENLASTLIKGIFRLFPGEKLKHLMAHFRIIPTISTNPLTDSIDLSFPVSTNATTVLEDVMQLIDNIGASKGRLIVVFDEFQDILELRDGIDKELRAMMQIQERDIVSFKNYFTENFENVKDSLNAYKYVYGLDVNIYVKNPGGKADTIMQTNPTTIFDYMGDDIKNMMSSMSSLSGNMATMAFFGEMMEGLEDKNGNKELINPVVKMQYELVGKESRWPENANEVLLVVDEKNRISNMALYALGFKDPDEIQTLLAPLTDPTKKYDNGIEEGFSYSLSDFVGHKFYYVMNADYYAPTEGYYTVNNKNYPVYEDLRERNDYDESAFLDQYGKELTIVGIVRKNANATSSSISTPIAYTAALTREITDYNDSSAVMKQQKETPEYDIFTGRTFEESEPSFDNIEGFLNTLSAEQKTFLLALINQTLETSITVETLPQLLASMPDAQFKALTKAYLPDASFTKEQIPEFLERIGLAGQAMLVENLKKQSAITEETLANALQLAGEKSFKRLVEAFLPEVKKTSYEKNLTLLGSNDDSQIQSINLYAVDFASKDQIKAFVEDYNKAVGEDKQVEVSDLMGSLLTGVSAVINAISYVLIAFVSVSLVVASIMIAIITYISVLELTKEIGILRSLGASKKTVRNVFNAETLIEGLCAGLLGVGVTLLLCLIANPIIHHLTGISSINAYLHPVAALILILISILLTMVAGLIPARMASKRDPVVALRTE